MNGLVGYTSCASEHNNCNFTGKQNVAFGVPPKNFIFRDFTNGTKCDVPTFGFDPAVGLLKQCYVTSQLPNVTIQNGIPQNFNLCSGEHGTCTVNGPSTIAFGYGNNFTFASTNYPVACNDTIFGDPSVGNYKQCFYQPYQTNPGNEEETYPEYNQETYPESENNSEYLPVPITPIKSNFIYFGISCLSYSLLCFCLIILIIIIYVYRKNMQNNQ